MCRRVFFLCLALVMAAAQSACQSAPLASPEPTQTAVPTLIPSPTSTLAPHYDPAPDAYPASIPNANADSFTHTGCFYCQCPGGRL